MRKTIAGLVAGAAFAATMATAPAQACAVTDPCGGYGYGKYSYGHGYGVRERLPDPAVQYYWVNQGPTYTGPGNFAPVPTYQERAVTGSRYYGRPYRYGYDGGPYGNATSHYYDGAPGVQGPLVTSYRFARRHHYRGSYVRPHRVGASYHHAARPSLRYGHSHRSYHQSHSHGPRVLRAKPHHYKY